MKKTLIIGLVLIFNTTSNANSGELEGYRAYGSGIANGCGDSFGVLEAEAEAENQAREVAKKRCDYFGSEVAEKTITIIGNSRGGCWAGIPAEAHIKLTYSCN